MAEILVGILDSVLAAVNESNEAAHGARLVKDGFATLALLRQSRSDVEMEGLALFVTLQSQILRDCHSWSKDGFLKAAKQLQAEAKKHKDFKVGTACGYYLAGAFCECMVRESSDAKLLLRRLNMVAEQVDRLRDEQARSLPSSASASPSRGTAARPQPDMVGMVDKCMTVVLSAFFWPIENERTVNEFVPRLRELTEGGREAVVGVSFGLIDGLCQKAGFGQPETLAIAAAFLSGRLTFTEQAVPEILKDMMAEASTNQYIALGGKAAFDFATDPNSMDALAECGLEVRRRIDASMLW